MSTTLTEQELIVEMRRTFPVTRERLFAAWTDPREVRHWFGPEGVKISEVEMDLRPGGKYAISVIGGTCESSKPASATSRNPSRPSRESSSR